MLNLPKIEIVEKYNKSFEINDYKNIFSVYDEAIDFARNKLTRAQFDDIYDKNIKTNLREIELDELNKIVFENNITELQTRRLKQLCSLRPYDILIKNVNTFLDYLKETYEGISLTDSTIYAIKMELKNFNHIYFMMNLIPRKIELLKLGKTHSTTTHIKDNGELWETRKINNDIAVNIIEKYDFKAEFNKFLNY